MNVLHVTYKEYESIYNSHFPSMSTEHTIRVKYVWDVTYFIMVYINRDIDLRLNL